MAAWRQWRSRSVFKAISDELTPGFDLYNLRHRWAMRSIETTSTNPYAPKQWVTPSRSMSRPTTVSYRARPLDLPWRS